jgi:hypothetical protein
MQDHEAEHERADDDQRGDQPADAEALQPVRDRIEQIGKRHAGDERQQNLVQDPQRGHADKKRQHPERHLARERHLVPVARQDVSPGAPCITVSRGAHVAHPFAQIHRDRGSVSDGDRRHHRE